MTSSIVEATHTRADQIRKYYGWRASNYDAGSRFEAEHHLEAIRRANAAYGTTVVLVTHDPLVSEQVQRTVGIRDGRTSSEVRRRTEIGSDGGEALIAEEYAVLDRAGRLQLPREFTEALDMRDRVRLDLETDHIGVWPDLPSGAETDGVPGEGGRGEAGPGEAGPGEAGPGEGGAR